MVFGCSGRFRNTHGVSSSVFDNFKRSKGTNILFSKPLPNGPSWTKFLRKAFNTTIEWPACIPDFNTVIQAQVILVIELNAKDKFDMVSW